MITSAPQWCLRVTDLHKAFEGVGTVLNGISLTVETGSRVALLGANGTGKSTFLKCLVGQLPPDTGTVNVFGACLGASSRRSALLSVRQRTGFVFQQHSLVRQQTVLSNVCHGLLGRSRGWRSWNHRIAAAQDRHEASLALESVGLGHLTNQRAHSLSGGQAQRVSIARALVGRPDILLADEPTASLDPAAGKAVMALLSDLTVDSETTLLFTTHNIDHAFNYADRVVLFAAGRILVDTNIDEQGRSLIDQHFELSAQATDEQSG